jgi:hypothetical protein
LRRKEIASQADLYNPNPSGACSCRGGNAVGMGGHQIHRPEERQLQAVHHRAGGHRGLPAAGGALPMFGFREARKPKSTINATVSAAPLE